MSEKKFSSVFAREPRSLTQGEMQRVGGGWKNDPGPDNQGKFTNSGSGSVSQEVAGG